MYRDTDVREAIRDALKSTDDFDDVYLWGLPENYGSGASRAALAVIEPRNSTQEDRWDDSASGELIVKSSVTITFLQRHEDPGVCDSLCDKLFCTAAKILNGTSLAGITLQPLTKFASWRWEKRIPPERRITSVFEYQYLLASWNDFDADTE